MKPVIQEEVTGCGIAASAALIGISYQQAKQTANALGIYTNDQSLWSDTQYIRRLLLEFGINTHRKLLSTTGKHYRTVLFWLSNGINNQGKLSGIGLCSFAKKMMLMCWTQNEP